MKIIKEGKVTLKIYPGNIKKSDKVFYNPKMVINRDISVLAVKAFTSLTSRDVLLIDSMSATGIRGLRYGTEVEKVKEVVFNDINPHAIKLIKENIILNKFNKPYIIENKEAGCLLHDYRFNGDVVDLDPFGTPAPYLDAAARCVSNKGLLMVTFTDTAVLSATYPKVALRRYGVTASKGYKPHQELALRVALSSIGKSLAKFDKGMIPLISINYEHFIRIIVQVDKHKNSANKIYDNIGSKSYKIKETKYIAEGVWTDKLGNSKFINEMIKYCNKLYQKETCKLLNILKEEYKYSNYYHIPTIAKHHKTLVKSKEKILERIEGTKAHFKNDFIIATNEPLDKIVNILIS